MGEHSGHGTVQHDSMASVADAERFFLAFKQASEKRSTNALNVHKSPVIWPTTRLFSVSIDRQTPSLERWFVSDGRLFAHLSFLGGQKESQL